MPGFNQNGPMGEGPMTGRKMGRCTNYGAKSKNEVSAEVPDSIVNPTDDQQARELLPGFGKGRGRGRGRNGMGRGMGRQNRFRGSI